MHVVCVNYYYDRRLTSAQELLTTYRTLTGWAEGLRSAGAQVSVVQRFGREETVRHNGILYRFVADPMRRAGLPADRASRINRAVVALQPDVVHVNGLYFAYQAWRLKRMLPRTPMILQDHKNPPPSNPVRFWTLRAFLSRLDAVTFVAKEQAQPWRETGILRLDMPLYELMESSSRFCLGSQVAARACTGLNGDPLCLWVGRLNSNKDPLTVLEGFARAQDCLPSAHLAMAYGEADMLAEVQDWLATHPTTAARVTLLGRLPNEALEEIYNSADLFLLGSHCEGSGFAVLEAISCGVVPVLTDIPSFRQLAGDIGALWPIGDPESLAQTLVAAYRRLQPETRQQVRAYFDARWSWEALGRQALDVYSQLAQRERR